MKKKDFSRKNAPCHDSYIYGMERRGKTYHFEETFLHLQIKKPMREQKASVEFHQLKLASLHVYKI